MNDGNEFSDCMSVPGLVAYFNGKEKVLSREFVYRMIKAGKIPSYRIGSKIFVRLPEVLASLRVTK